MSTEKHTEHSTDEIYSALLRADVSAVATHEGINIKQRQMHFAPSKDLGLYFATMKGDPKTMQITDDRNVSILILDRSGEMHEWSETELSGYMDIIKDDTEKRVAALAMYDRSPIVKNLTDAKMDHILEWLVLRPTSVKHRIFGEIVQGFPPTIKTFDTVKTKSIFADIARSWKRMVTWYYATRSLFLVATVLPIVLGCVIAYTSGVHFSFALAGLTLIAGMFMHIGANLLNDYMDHLGGSDEANTDFTRPFTGGSRMIQLGLIAPHVVLQTALFFTAVGVLIGLYLAFVSGPLLFVIGFLGVLAVFMYSIPKVGLASIGLGEVSIGLVFGPLMTLGAYYVQAGVFAWAPVIASIPIAGLITLILFVNEFPDYKADRSVGKRTLVVRLGLEKSTPIYLAFGLATFLLFVRAVVSGVVPVEALSTLIAFPFVIWSWVIMRANLHDPKSLTPACAATATAHLVAGLAVISAYLSTYFGFMPVGFSLYVTVAGLAIGFMTYIIKKSNAFTRAKQTFEEK